MARSSSDFAQSGGKQDEIAMKFPLSYGSLFFSNQMINAPSSTDPRVPWLLKTPYTMDDVGRIVLDALPPSSALSMQPTLCRRCHPAVGSMSHRWDIEPTARCHRCYLLPPSKPASGFIHTIDGDVGATEMETIHRDIDAERPQRWRCNRD
eukprot:Gb_30450 [translate_table: standard]